MIALAMAVVVAASDPAVSEALRKTHEQAAKVEALLEVRKCREIAPCAACPRVEQPPACVAVPCEPPPERAPQVEARWHVPAIVGAAIVAFLAGLFAGAQQ